jgi:CHASE2 domain-containing sensor protein
MVSKVRINLHKGNLEKGCPSVLIDLETNGGKLTDSSQLSSAPDLKNSYDRWYELYQLYYPNCRSRDDQDDDDPDEITRAGITQIGDDTKNLLNQSAENLVKSLNNWLKDQNSNPHFCEVIEKIKLKLDPKDKVSVIIEVENQELQKLPWEWWDFVQKNPRAGLSLGNLSYASLDRENSHHNYSRVRLLGVLGDDFNIETKTDRQEIESRKNITSKFIEQPSIQNLTDTLSEKTWDILFYSGHGNRYGVISLSSSESLDITRIRTSLQHAIDRGLSLAIFNCCWGLDLANQVKELNLPAMIVMREEVPNAVAQRFLKYLLGEFCQGVALDIALRKAQERLQEDREEYPGAYFLPILIRNPSERLPDWPVIPWSRKWLKVISLSAIATSFVMGIRLSGGLEQLELKAFDFTTRQIPSESTVDKRFLRIEIGVEETDRYGYPLPDAILAKALHQLYKLKPAVIGLDIHRFQLTGEGRQELIDRFRGNKNLFTVCAFGNWGTQYNPPSELTRPPLDQQIGFSNFLDNDRDDILRRQLLSYDPKQDPEARSQSGCSTPYSFSFQLAYRFLESKGFQTVGVKDKTLEAKDRTLGVQDKSLGVQDTKWKLGSVVFETLPSRFGGYQNLDGKISQIMINYRARRSPGQKDSLQEVLSGSLNPESARGRVVIIGYTASVANDEFNTPEGRKAGMWVHARMTGQILDAVLDGQPLIWAFPQWGDALFIFAICIFGGLFGELYLLVLRGRGYGKTVAIAISIGFGLFYILIGFRLFYFLSVLALQRGLWLPLIPTSLSWLIFVGLLLTINLVRNHENH